jgi:hypothetical protein
VRVELPAARQEAHTPIDDLIALDGAGIMVSELADGPEVMTAAPGIVRLGVHRSGPLPAGPLEAFDILLSAEPSAPRPWVGVRPERLDGQLAYLAARVAAQPVAAAVAAQVLRTTLQVSFDQALVVESLAYSMLLASEGFRAWRGANPPRDRAPDADPRVLIEAEGPILQIHLNRPAARNAFDARMRDELVEALAFAIAHPDAPAVELGALGPSFSAGGDLDEFGRADDAGRAHLVRTLRSPAALVGQLGARVTARLHGACVGAGIEVPAAAARVTARRGSYFRLPEVSMGLIPGAGGTASIARRMGRRRTTYMAISGADIDLSTALAWGLVDAEEQGQ